MWTRDLKRSQSECSVDLMSYHLEVFADNYVEAEWFCGLSPLLSGVTVSMIGRRGTNPRAIEEVVRYDKPDIVLLSDGRPVLVLEITSEVPTGHNFSQRWARMVRAAELGVPSLFFGAYRLKKHGEHSGICHINSRLFDSLIKMTEIHQVPSILVEWPSDQDGELVRDGSENSKVSELVCGFLEHGLKPWWPKAQEALEENRHEHRRRVVRPSDGGRPPPSLECLDTNSLLGGLPGRLGQDELSLLSNRRQTVVYTIGMTPEKCKRQDPYTGTQFVYDYQFCRSGAKVELKHTNLVLRFPNIAKSTFLRINPNDPESKSCNWYLTADAMVFSDGALLLRGSAT